jgi:PhnB protein
MANNVQAIPAGFHSITPALTCKNAAKAIDFYKQALGAKEISRMEMPGGGIGHADLQIGDSHFFLNDEYPDMAAAPDGKVPSVSLFVYTEDVDSIFNKAVAAGCTVTMPLQDMFWGDRYGKFTDPFGHHWGLAQHIEDVAPDEMERRSKEWQASMAKSAGGQN